VTTVSQHPKVRRPDPGAYVSWLDSWTLSLHSDGRSERTITGYLDALRLFAGWLRATHPKVTDWDGVGAAELRRYFTWLQTAGAPCPHGDALRGSGPPASCAGYSKAYVSLLARALQQFFTWFAEEEGVPNPLAKVTLPAAPKLGEKLVPVIPPEDLLALIKDAEKSPEFHDRRDAAILRLFACAGVRLSELAHLRLGDVTPITRREATVTGKGGRERTVKFDAKAASALDRYVRTRGKRKGAPDGPTAPLWLGHRQGTPLTTNGIYQLIARRGRALGLTVHPHMFRHTFAHRWLDAGGAEGDLMELAGWDSPQMLAHYGRSARSARARRSYDGINVMGGM
jgi:integrase